MEEFISTIGEKRNIEKIESTAAAEKKTVVTASGSPTVTMIFSVLCIIFWAFNMGWIGEGGRFAIGVVQIAVFAGYIIGSAFMLKTGDSFGGNVNMICATFFGGIGGFTNVVSSITGEQIYNFKIFGIAFTMLGLMLIILAPLLKRESVMSCVIFLTGGFSTTMMGLMSIGFFAGTPMGTIAAWSLLVCGGCGFASVIMEMAGYLDPADDK